MEKPDQLAQLLKATYVRPGANLVAEYVNNLFDPANSRALSYLTDERKLSIETLQSFKVGCNERGDIAIPVFKDGVLVDFKYRSVPPAEKHFYRVPSSETWVVNDNAFQLAAESKNKQLLVTEGELDAFSAWQLGILPVVSSVGGAGEVRRAEWIERIPKDCKVYICYDNDPVGQDSARQLAERIGLERCFNVILPGVKDTNEFLQKGGTGEQYLKILQASRRFEADGVARISDVIEELEKNPVKKEATHIERLNRFTKGGIPHKGLVMISGRYGTGKSSLLLNFLIHHANNGKPVLLITLENDMALTLQRILEIKYQKPMAEFTPEMWGTIKKELLDYPFYIDMSMQSYSMKQIEKITRQSKKLYGIEFMGYDHMHWAMSEADASELDKASREFKILCNEADIITYLVCHVRKLGKDQHILTGEDMKGSSGMAQAANMVMMLQNFGSGMEINLDKSRESRSHLRFPLIFNGETGVMEDDPSRKVKHFDQELDDEDSAETSIVPQVIDREPTRTITNEEIDGY